MEISVFHSWTKVVYVNPVSEKKSDRMQCFTSELSFLRGRKSTVLGQPSHSLPCFLVNKKARNKSLTCLGVTGPFGFWEVAVLRGRPIK